MAIQQTRDTDRGKGAARKRWTAQPMGQELDALVGSSDSATLQRAVMDPRVASPADILALQRSFGNEAVSGLIQAKLTVGPAGDQYEQEADRVAQQVMSIPAPGSRPRSAARGQPGVQRQEMEEEEELQMKRVARQPLVQRFVAQRQAPEEEEELQLKAVQRQPPEQEGTLMMKPIQQVGPEGGPVPEEVRSAINRAQGAGQPLDGPVQEQMSAGMGHDFRGVRVHTDSEADVLNQQLSARAFTTGQDIFFRQGEYQPGSSSGRELIAHELSHVVQQSTGRVDGGSNVMTVRPGADTFEQEADVMGREATQTKGISPLQRAAANPAMASSTDISARQQMVSTRVVKRLLAEANRDKPRAQPQLEGQNVASPIPTELVVQREIDDGTVENARAIGNEIEEGRQVLIFVVPNDVSLGVGNHAVCLSKPLHVRMYQKVVNDKIGNGIVGSHTEQLKGIKLWDILIHESVLSMDDFLRRVTIWHEIGHAINQSAGEAKPLEFEIRKIIDGLNAGIFAPARVQTHLASDRGENYYKTYLKGYETNWQHQLKDAIASQT